MAVSDKPQAVTQTFTPTTLPEWVRKVATVVNWMLVRANYPPCTVAQLPAAASAGAGARGYVTDATATTFASTVAGTGSNKVPVYCDGTNWRIG